MAPPPAAYDLTRRYTVEEVLAFPDDGNRYELIDGELLVSPAPRAPHQIVLGRLYRMLGNYLDTFGLADTVCFSPADITWGPHTLVQPDIFVTRPEELTQEWGTIKNLRLIIEVISPSTAGNDRIRKRDLYQRQGVETYWIVDSYQRQIEVWTPTAPAPVIHTESITWHHTPAAPPLYIDLLQLWRPPLSDRNSGNLHNEHI